MFEKGVAEGTKMFEIVITNKLFIKKNAWFRTSYYSM